MTTQKTTLTVDGMSCGHCSAMVQRTLEAIEGISNVLVDLDGKKANFDADTPALIDIAIEKINEAGYTASKPNPMAVPVQQKHTLSTPGVTILSSFPIAKL